jgi:2-hydroxy-6-oxonona-2,4-dienedioate hydrolase
MRETQVLRLRCACWWCEDLSRPLDSRLRGNDENTAMTATLITQLEAQATRHMIEVEGRFVCWRQFGNGPPVVLLHGGHGSWLHWVRNIEALATRFAVWVPDLPGFGESDDLGPSRSGDMADLVHATLTSLDMLVGADTWVDMVGFSFGGLVAAQMAARRPRIRHLVLLGAAGHGGLRRPRGELMNWHRAKTQEAIDVCMHHNLHMHMLFDAAQIDALALDVHSVSCKRARFRSRPISQAGGLSVALAQTSAQVLMVWGEHDVTAEPAVLMTSLVEGQPQRQGRILPGVGHWVQYESAAEVNRLLLEVL